MPFIPTGAWARHLSTGSIPDIDFSRARGLGVADVTASENIAMAGQLHRRRRNPAEADDDRPLTQLGHDLSKCRSRAGRQWRSYQRVDDKLDPVASAAAHQAWSDAVDDALRIAEAISRARPRDLGELLIQFEAIWWWLIEDDSVLDSGARRWLRRFRRSLRQLAAKT